MRNKKQIITILLSVLITLAVVFTVFFGIKLFYNYQNQSSDEAPSTTNPVCADPTTSPKAQSGNKTTIVANQDALKVSIIQLIADPETYDGKLVRVIGVGNLEFEGNYISLNKEDYKYHVGNSIWLELGENAISYEEAAQYNGEYVIVEGVFDKDDCGHLGMFYGSIKNISRYELWDANQSIHCDIIQQTDLTYSFEITDYNGQVLDHADNLPTIPKRQFVSADVLGVVRQAGTGFSTNYARYYDLENSKISETFYYVLDAQNGKVVYADRRDGEYFVVIQDIFDINAFYLEYKLENVSPVAADFVIDGYFNAEGNVCITYLSGDDYTQTNDTIQLQPKEKSE